MPNHDDDDNHNNCILNLALI